jgi:peptidoglycan/xylan/chitin deacetylase (PgdA/CDA1 family)
MTDPTKALAKDSALVAKLLASRPLIRALNFHNTPMRRQAELDRQLAHCAQHFSPVDQHDLERWLASGEWRKPKPGMILAFYEGYRNGYDVIRPLLAKHGLTGWFFIITGFVDTPAADQLEYALAHDIGMETREYADGRYALSWDEIRALDKKHVIASHARSHQPIAAMDAVSQRAEVLGSQVRIISELGQPAQSFVSYGGPAYGEDAAVDALVGEAGYRFQFSNYRIQRLPASAAEVT